MATTAHIGLKGTESFEDEYGVEHVMMREHNGIKYHIHISIINNVGGSVGIYKENYTYSYTLFELPMDEKMFNMMVYSIITEGKTEKVLFN